MTRARQILLFLGACAVVACGGDDDGIIIADSGTADGAGPLCGDYDETSDETNDAFAPAGGAGTAETSTIDFAAGDTRTICGVIDTGHFADQVVDIDAFDFEVGAGAPIRAILRAPDAPEEAQVFVILQFITDQGALSAGGGSLGAGYALATSFQAVEGTWRLVVIAGAEAALSGSFEYELEIGNTFPCDAVEADADYDEARDGTRSRRNDVATATWGQGLTTAATEVETDNPEPTELTLEADTPVRLTGTAGNRQGTDSYRDRDTFAIAIGEGVNEIDFRVTWPDDANADLDALAFIAEMPEQDITGAGAAFGGTMLDELVTTRVGAGNLWLWVGNYNDGEPMLPMDYDVTICPRSFTP